MEVVTDAIVLHRSEYKDYDRMLTLFSPTLGRIDAAARGCRRTKSPLVGASELFCAGEYTLYCGKDRYSITQCRVLENFYGLRMDIDKLTHAVYCAGLAESTLMPGEPAPALFELLLKALTHLNHSDLPPALLTAAFEMRLMPVLGFAPRMDRCVRCGKPVTGDGRFDPVLGGSVCLDCPSLAPPMTNGARRIILRAAQTDYNAVPLLADHPDWPLAARLYRPFVEMRIDRPHAKTAPPLP